jgi:Uma2 family endonuclease
VWDAPGLVVEVMSPRPRIGSLDERLEWFARYGVRECWLVRPAIRQVWVIAFANGTESGRRVFEPLEGIASMVPSGPQLKETPHSMLTAV